MSLKDFEDHLKLPLPGFRCSPPDQHYVVRVRHRMGAPATRAAIGLLKKTLGKSADGTIVQFYSKHDGVTLYSQPGFAASGLRFLPIRQWAAATRRWYSRSPDEELDDWGDPLPRRAQTSIVFAEILGSGNSFLLRTVGKQARRVFYDNHDNPASKPFAENFASLLDMVCRDPAAFLYNCGCYTRYSDGETGIQWIPKTYISNVRKTT